MDETMRGLWLEDQPLSFRADLPMPELDDDKVSARCIWRGYAPPVSYTHLRAHETVLDLVCRLLLEKKNYLLFQPL